MALVLYSKNARNISWAWHSITRYQVNRAAKRIARTIDQKHIELSDITAEGTILSERDIDTLRAAGVSQIEKVGQFSSGNRLTTWVTVNNGFIHALGSAIKYIKSSALLLLAPRGDGDDTVIRYATYVEHDASGRPLRYQISQAPSQGPGRLERVSASGVTYRAPNNEGKDSFRYVASDRDGNSSKEVAVEVFVEDSTNNFARLEDVSDTHIRLYINKGGQARLNFAVRRLPADALLRPSLAEHHKGSRNTTAAYNFDLLDGTYSHVAEMRDARNPANFLPYYGELSGLEGVMPGEFDDKPIPDVIIKSESAPPILSYANGGRAEFLDFGNVKLIDLVQRNARYLLGSLAEGVRDKFTVFLGKADRYIKFFGRATVGTQTLEEFTASKGEKETQCMLLTRPISEERLETQGEHMAFALVNKATGKIKYCLPPATLTKHINKVLNSLGIKLAAGVTGEELLPIIAEIREDSSLDVNEERQLNIFESVIKQKDLETEWAFREVIPGGVVARKSWMQRLTQALEELEETYPGSSQALSIWGNEGQNAYTLINLVFLAMSTSDQGFIQAGYAAKFPATKGKLDQGFLRALYNKIRTEVFIDKTWYAINIGEGSELLEFGDQVTKAGGVPIRIQRGEQTFKQVVKATITDDRDHEEECTYWRQVLDLPWQKNLLGTCPSLFNSLIGAQRRYYDQNNLAHLTYRYDQVTMNPLSWLPRVVRDKVIIGSEVGQNIDLDGPAYIMYSRLNAKKPTRLQNPFISIASTGTLGPQVGARDEAVLYHYQDVANAATERPGLMQGPINKGGFYLTVVERKAFPGAGKKIARSFEYLPPLSGNGTITETTQIEDRSRIRDKYLKDLCPDSAAIVSRDRIRAISDQLDRHAANNALRVRAESVQAVRRRA